MSLILRVNYNLNADELEIRKQHYLRVQKQDAFNKNNFLFSGYWLPVSTVEEGQAIALEDNLCSYFFIKSSPSGDPYDKPSTVLTSGKIVDKVIAYSSIADNQDIDSLENKRDFLRRSGVDSTHILYDKTNKRSTISFITDKYNGRIYNRDKEDITPSQSAFEKENMLIEHDIKSGQLQIVENLIKRYRAKIVTSRIQLHRKP